MLIPTKVDRWYAEAVTRVYAPWLASRCTVIGARHRHEVAELIQRARRAACLPPLERLGPPAAAPSVRQSDQSEAWVGAVTGPGT